MLIDPIFLPMILTDEMITSSYGNVSEAEKAEIRDKFTPKRIAKGIYTYGTCNLRLFIKGAKRTDRYGTCDNPQQFVDKFAAELDQLPEQFVVSLSELHLRDAEDFQFHKMGYVWGEYCGNEKSSQTSLIIFAVLEIKDSE